MKVNREVNSELVWKESGIEIKGRENMPPKGVSRISGTNPNPRKPSNDNQTDSLSLSRNSTFIFSSAHSDSGLTELVSFKIIPVIIKIKKKNNAQFLEEWKMKGLREFKFKGNSMKGWNRLSF